MKRPNNYAVRNLKKYLYLQDKNVEILRQEELLHSEKN